MTRSSKAHNKRFAKVGLVTKFIAAIRALGAGVIVDNPLINTVAY
jgi:hypothetical protein